LNGTIPNEVAALSLNQLWGCNFRWNTGLCCKALFLQKFRFE